MLPAGSENTVPKSNTRPPPRAARLPTGTLSALSASTTCHGTSGSEGLGEHCGGEGGEDKQGFLEKERWMK